MDGGEILAKFHTFHTFQSVDIKAESAPRWPLRDHQPVRNSFPSERHVTGEIEQRTTELTERASRMSDCVQLKPLTLTTQKKEQNNGASHRSERLRLV